MYIDCKNKAQEIKNMLKNSINKKKPPTLVVIQVGDDSASNSYIKGKKKDCEEIGIICHHIKYENDISEKYLLTKVKRLQKLYDGIIVQLPLPKHISEQKVIDIINPIKDVDGFKSNSPYISCTPMGIMFVLENYNLAGKDVLIINRSNIVGRPLVNLLLDRDATVTIAHSKTKDIKNKIKSADIIITAVGVSNFIKREDLKEGQIVIDVAINRNEEGKLCGDVEKGVDDIVDITPVPGGIGLMTRAALLMNTYEAFVLQKRGE